MNVLIGIAIVLSIVTVVFLVLGGTHLGMYNKYKWRTSEAEPGCDNRFMQRPDGTFKYWDGWFIGCGVVAFIFALLAIKAS